MEQLWRREGIFVSIWAERPHLVGAALPSAFISGCLAEALSPILHWHGMVWRHNLLKKRFSG